MLRVAEETWITGEGKAREGGTRTQSELYSNAMTHSSITSLCTADTGPWKFHPLGQSEQKFKTSHPKAEFMTLFQRPPSASTDSWRM